MKRFWTIWEEQKDFLFSLALHYTDDHHDAQDLLSDLMLKASCNINKKLLRTNPQGWMVKLLKNIYFDQYRRGNKRQINIIFTDKLDGLDKYMDLAVQTPLDRIYSQELSQFIEGCLRNAPAYRSLVTRLYFSGTPYSALAESFEISNDNLRKMIQLSRHEISQELEYYYSEKKEHEPVRKRNNKQKKLYPHLIKLKISGDVHYFNFVCECPPGRLEQKEKTIKKYLVSHSHSPKQQLALVQNLCSQGKVDQGLRILKDLRLNNYHSEKLYDLLINLLFLLNRKKELNEVITKALDLLPAASSKLHAWNMLVKGRLKEAETLIKVHSTSLPLDISSRLLLIKIYDLQGKDMAVYTECENVNTLSPDHPEIFTYHLKNKLDFEGFYEAREYARKQYELFPTSAIPCFFYLYFLLSEGYDLSCPKLATLYNFVRKRFLWHPDLALIKAFLYPGKVHKILERRSRDYPDCTLSKHYLALFCKWNSELPNLNRYDERHFSIIKKILQDKKPV